MTINDDGNFYDYSTGMIQDTTVYYKKKFLISNFRHVLNVVCFLLDNSPASEFQMPGYYPEENIQHKKTCYQIACNQKRFVCALQINYIKCILIDHH